MKSQHFTHVITVHYRLVTIESIEIINHKIHINFTKLSLFKYQVISKNFGDNF